MLFRRAGGLAGRVLGHHPGHGFQGAVVGCDRPAIP
jgi:hypothetical protein